MIRRSAKWFVLFGFLFYCVSSCASAETASSNGSSAVLLPASGSPDTASLAALDAAWNAEFSVGGHLRREAAGSWIRWGACVEKLRESAAIFADGGVVILAPGSLRINSGKLIAETASFGEVQIPTELLVGAVVLPPGDRLRYDRWIARCTAADSRRDGVLSTNGDETLGTIRSLEGRRLELHTEVGPVALELPRVESLAFGTPGGRRAASEKVRGWVGLADGSRLAVDRVTLKDRTVRLSLACGLVWNAKAEDLVFLQPTAAGAVYLSDLAPTGYRHVPFLSSERPYCNDRNVLGGMLRAGGRLYLKGLGLPSASRLTYALDRPFRRFEAELAVDEQAAGGGSVRCRVFVDGRLQYTSPVIRGGTAPLPLRVELGEAKRLDLVVDYADRGDQRDYADWLDARLIP